MTTESNPVAVDGIIHLTAFDQITDGTIDVIRTGHFTDSRGREVDITQEDLDAMVLNFHARSAGQDIPIDIDHEFAQAAGWLTDLTVRGSTLVAAPEWNTLGKELVGNKVYRYISATINLGQRLLMSASLVNFPAVKGMRPVALSDGQAASIDTFIFQEDKTMKTANTAPAAETAAPANVTNAETTAAETTTAAATTEQQPVQLEANLNLDLAQLANLMPANIVAEFANALRAQTEQQLTALRATLEQERAALEQQRAAIINDTITQLREEQEIATFATRVTSTGRFALPHKPDEVKVLLSSLPKANRKAVQDFLDAITQQGTVDFSEVGTQAPRNGGVQQLDKYVKAELDSFIADGGTIEAFFKVNADILGPASNYDLTAYAAK